MKRSETLVNVFLLKITIKKIHFKNNSQKFLIKCNYL